MEAPACSALLQRKVDDAAGRRLEGKKDYEIIKRIL